jgi:hypothetical protein
LINAAAPSHEPIDATLAVELNGSRLTYSVAADSYPTTEGWAYQVIDGTTVATPLFVLPEKNFSDLDGGLDVTETGFVDLPRDEGGRPQPNDPFGD